MPLTPEAEALMAMLLERSPGVGVRVLDAKEARRIQRENPAAPDPPPVGNVAELSIPGPPGSPAIAARVYTPLEAGTRPPLLVFFHGGGWVICSLDTHDAMSRRLANGSGAIVVSVDYRLAPEDPFPAAIEDAYAAVTWVQAHGAELGGDPEQVGVAGDSAGGNLAAVVPLMLRDRGGVQVALQVLVYPVADGRLDTLSYAEFAEGGGYVTRAEMEWFWQQYVGHGDRTQPYASPLLADLDDLPPAIVVVAECDPLRDEGTAYARKLADAGNEVAFSQYDGVYHGFFGMATLLDEARRANDEVCTWVRQVFEEKVADGQA